MTDKPTISSVKKTLARDDVTLKEALKTSRDLIEIVESLHNNTATLCNAFKKHTQVTDIQDRMVRNRLHILEIVLLVSATVGFLELVAKWGQT